MTKRTTLPNLANALEDIIDNYTDKTEEGINKAVRASVVDVWSGIIQDTPVDTGEARGAWTISTGVPSKRKTIANARKGRSYVLRRTKQLQVNKSMFGRKWFLTNNKSYAFDLEYGGYNGPTPKVTSSGYSRQAPRGMVRRNLLRWRRVLKKNLAKAKRIKKTK